MWCVYVTDDVMLIRRVLTRLSTIMARPRIKSGTVAIEMVYPPISAHLLSAYMEP